MEKYALDLKTNLCQITGDGSLIKLNMADGEAMVKRYRLLAELNREPDTFNSAVFIYFCNVLEDMGIGNDYVDRKPLITGLADALMVCCLLYSTGGVDDKTFSRKIDEVFYYGYYLDRKHYPTYDQLLKIREDFPRINNVWRRQRGLLPQ